MPLTAFQSPNRLLARLKPRHLTLITQLADLGSVTRVARALGISQPAATKALAEVEDIFEGPLFLRSTTGMLPTPLGELAITRAHHMLQDLDHWSSDMASLRSGRSAHLRIGAVPYVSGELLTQALVRMHADDNVTITLHRATTDVLMKMLAGREIDCVIGRASAVVMAADVEHEILFTQRAAMIAHPRLAARLARRALDWHALAQMNWILPSPTTPVGIMVTELFTRASARPPLPMFETYSVDVIAGAIRNDESVLSIVPEDIAPDLQRTAGVGIVPWTMDWALPPISLIRRVRDAPLPAEEKFTVLLRELCAAMRARAE